MKHETIEGSYYGFAASVHVALAMAISSQRVVALGESMVRRMRQSAPVSASSRPRPRMPAYPMPACTAPYRWLMASIASASLCPGGVRARGASCTCRGRSGR